MTEERSRDVIWPVFLVAAFNTLSASTGQAVAGRAVTATLQALLPQLQPAMDNQLRRIERLNEQMLHRLLGVQHSVDALLDGPAVAAREHIQYAARLSRDGQNGFSELELARSKLFDAYGQANTPLRRYVAAGELAAIYALRGEANEAVVWLTKAETAIKDEFNRQCDDFRGPLERILKRSKPYTDQLYWPRVIEGWIAAHVAWLPDADNDPLVRAARRPAPGQLLARPDADLEALARGIADLGIEVDFVAIARAAATRRLLARPKEVQPLAVLTEPLSVSSLSPLAAHRARFEAAGRRWTVNAAFGPTSPFDELPAIPEDGSVSPSVRERGPSPPPSLHFTDWRAGVDVALRVVGRSSPLAIG